MILLLEYLGVDSLFAVIHDPTYPGGGVPFSRLLKGIFNKGTKDLLEIPDVDDAAAANCSGPPFNPTRRGLQRGDAVKQSIVPLIHKAEMGLLSAYPNGVARSHPAKRVF